MSIIMDYLWLIVGVSVFIAYIGIEGIIKAIKDEKGETKMEEETEETEEEEEVWECEVCGEEFGVEDSFLFDVSHGEVVICKDCIDEKYPREKEIITEKVYVQPETKKVSDIDKSIFEEDLE